MVREEYQTHYRQKNKEKISAYQVEYRKKNKDKLSKNKKAYYQKNKDEINKRRREKYALENPKKKKSLYKICTTCGIKFKKDISNFRYKSVKRNILTFRSTCRKCEKATVKEYRSFGIGQERKNLSDKKWRDDNLDRKKTNDKKWYNDNKDYVLKRSVQWRAEQRKINPQIAIRDTISSRIRSALKQQKVSKRNSTIELLGCSIPELKRHLEKQFQPGMNWKNNTVRGWHIDHIVPCAKFDLTKVEQQKKCFNYTNLQPLWAIDNLLKKDK